MSAFGQIAATRGSQKWIQRLVNTSSSTLDREIVAASAGKIQGPVTWRSPLGAENYREYHDQAFIDRLGLRLTKTPLTSFWPTGGPHWDALGVAADGAAILVEAKAHTAETKSDCGATAEASLTQIRGSLAQVQRHLGVDPSRDWTKTHYQYANRLAHLYLLRELNSVPAWLVFVHFVSDEEMRGPRTREEWVKVQRGIHDALGIRADALPGVLHVCVDVSQLS